ncbi:MAG: hypothetical protein ABSG46_20525 [Candidatus Binataceae bacterium]|jgi:hypothetical protein
MRLEQVQTAVNKIRVAVYQGDFEKAHVLEDDLYKSVLFDVARGSADARKKASVALTSQHIDFARVCS